MLSVLLALIAAACFVIMIVALLVAIRLTDWSGESGNTSCLKSHSNLTSASARGPPLIW